MKLPTLTVLLTVNDRSHEVLLHVLDSLRAQPYDRLIVVADGIEPEADESLRILLPTMERSRRVDIARPRGWLCPARAWNVGLAAVETELVMMISSETIQAAGNVAVAKELLAGPPMVVFGSARCSIDGCPEVVWPDGTAPHILCDAAHPRPLGFVAALPAWMVRATGGFDENFMAGHWYDDEDFFYRLWCLGQPFLFTDALSGIHQHHERRQLSDIGRETNRRYITSKFGTEAPFGHLGTSQGRFVAAEPGRTIWRHRCGRCSVPR